MTSMELMTVEGGHFWRERVTKELALSLALEKTVARNKEKAAQPVVLKISKVPAPPTSFSRAQKTLGTPQKRAEAMRNYQFKNGSWPATGTSMLTLATTGGPPAPAVNPPGKPWRW